MTDNNLSSFIWSVADLLRGDYKQSEYGRVILPFTVLRRLDCVLEPTKAAVLAEKKLREKAKLNPEPFLLKKAGQFFFNMSPLDLKKLMGDQDSIAENLRVYVQAFSPSSIHASCACGSTSRLKYSSTSSDSGTFSVSRKSESATGLPFPFPFPFPFSPTTTLPFASRCGRSTVMVRYPNSSFLKMRLMGTPSRVTFLNSPKMRVMSSMCSGLSSLRLLPRLLRIFWKKPLAAMSCTFPFRGAGFRLLTTQT